MENQKQLTAARNAGQLVASAEKLIRVASAFISDGAFLDGAVRLQQAVTLLQVAHQTQRAAYGMEPIAEDAEAVYSEEATRG